jgi:hypothetical protein
MNAKPPAIAHLAFSSGKKIPGSNLGGKGTIALPGRLAALALLGEKTRAISDELVRVLGDRGFQ